MNQKAACGLWAAEVHLSTEATGSSPGLFRGVGMDGIFTAARVLMTKVLTGKGSGPQRIQQQPVCAFPDFVCSTPKVCFRYMSSEEKMGVWGTG